MFYKTCKNIVKINFFGSHKVLFGISWGLEEVSGGGFRRGFPEGGSGGGFRRGVLEGVSGRGFWQGFLEGVSGRIFWRGISEEGLWRRYLDRVSGGGLYIFSIQVSVHLRMISLT